MAAHDAGLFGLHQVLRRDDSSDPKSTSSSASGLVSTLVPALAVAAIMTVGFIILRRSHRRMYVPRTYVGSLRPWEHTPASPTGLWNWITGMYKLPDTYVLQHHSLDAYLLLRFVKLSSVICFVGCLITWPVLFPVNATGHGGSEQLDLLTISNIGENSRGRYFAHVFIAWIFVSFIFFTVTREILYYINLRQAYLFSPAYASRLSSRTVLFTAVPEPYLNKEKIFRMFGPEKVKNVWLASDTGKLEDKVKRRDAAAMKLEAAETKLIRLANKAHLKAVKKHGGVEDANGLDASDAANGESGSVAAKWVKAKDRPTHRLKFLIGKKVDTINWARAEIERLSAKIETLQAQHRSGEAKLVTSVFVEFHTQADAQAAFQSVAHNLPLHMAPRYIGVDPTQIVWANLRIKWWERIIRYSGTIAFVVALVIFWAIPTAVVGFISNLDNVTDKVHFLRFIKDIPPVILGVVTSLLPTVLMSVLMALLPIVLRLMAKWGGAPSLAAIELTTQNFYFAFQVIQVFLVVTLSSAATSSVQSIIDDPTSAATLLAKNIPRASNFYVSYIILQGLSFSAGTLIQISGLIVGKIMAWLFDDTPRKMYTRWATLAGLGWGTVYPPLSLLLVIAVTYSCIAPLVMGFATIGLYLFYFAYRYNLLYVSNADIDTQGKAYVRALQHVTVGAYLLMVCLIGLFAIGTASATIAVGPLVLMIIFLVFTIIYHISLNQAVYPLIEYLPKNLEAEEEALLEQERSKVSQASDGYTAKEAAGASAVLPEGHPAHQRGPSVDTAEKGLTGNTVPAQRGRLQTLVMKYLRPDQYANYETLRPLVPGGTEVTTYSPDVEEHAYLHPSITAEPPLLWIPHDELGVSKQEIEHTSRIIPITDEGSWLDSKNKIHWDIDRGNPPIYEEKVYY